MNFTDVLFVISQSLMSVHAEEHRALTTAMLYAFGDADQLSPCGHDIIMNAVDDHGGDFIAALTELLNEDDEQ